MGCGVFGGVSAKLTPFYYTQAYTLSAIWIEIA